MGFRNCSCCSVGAWVWRAAAEMRIVTAWWPAARGWARIMGSMEAKITVSPEKGRYDFGVVSTATRKSMQGNKRRDTKPEMQVRRMLREMGFPGYRCDWKKVPGHPDVVFVGRKLAIEIRGCFWHRCPVCNLSVPKKNVDYWEAKFARNRERDERNLAALQEMGWQVLVLWEHQLKKKELPATRRVLYEFVRREDDPPYDEAFPEEKAATESRNIS